MCEEKEAQYEQLQYIETTVQTVSELKTCNSKHSRRVI